MATRTSSRSTVHAGIPLAVDGNAWATNVEQQEGAPPGILGAVAALLGHSTQVQGYRNPNLDTRSGPAHSTTGLQYAISGDTKVVEQTVGAWLASYEDPIRAILPMAISNASSIKVARQFVTGGGVTLVPEHASAPTVAIQEDYRTIEMDRYGGDIEMNLNLFLKPDAASKELNLKIDHQKRELSRQLTILAYETVVREGTDIVQAIIRSQPSQSASAYSADKTARIYCNLIFGALNKSPYGISNLLSAARYASAYATGTRPHGTIMIIPRGVPDILRYARPESLTYSVTGFQSGKNEGNKGIDMNMEGAYVCNSSGVKIAVHYPQPTYEQGTANPHVGLEGLSHTKKVVSIHTITEDGQQIVNCSTGGWHTGSTSTSNHLNNPTGNISLNPKLVKDHTYARISTCITSHAILATPGAETGEMLVGYPSTGISTSHNEERMRIQLRAYMGIGIYQPDNILVMKDAFCESIEEEELLDITALARDQSGTNGLPSGIFANLKAGDPSVSSSRLVQFTSARNADYVTMDTGNTDHEHWGKISGLAGPTSFNNIEGDPGAFADPKRIAHKLTDTTPFDSPMGDVDAATISSYGENKLAVEMFKTQSAATHPWDIAHKWAFLKSDLEQNENACKASAKVYWTKALKPLIDGLTGFVNKWQMDFIIHAVTNNILKAYQTAPEPHGPRTDPCELLFFLHAIDDVGSIPAERIETVLAQYVANVKRMHAQWNSLFDAAGGTPNVKQWGCYSNPNSNWNGREFFATPEYTYSAEQVAEMITAAPGEQPLYAAILSHVPSGSTAAGAIYKTTKRSTGDNAWGKRNDGRLDALPIAMMFDGKVRDVLNDQVDKPDDKKHAGYIVEDISASIFFTGADTAATNSTENVGRVAVLAALGIKGGKFENTCKKLLDFNATSKTGNNQNTTPGTGEELIPLDNSSGVAEFTLAAIQSVTTAYGIVSVLPHSESNDNLSELTSEMLGYEGPIIDSLSSGFADSATTEKTNYIKRLAGLRNATHEHPPGGGVTGDPHHELRRLVSVVADVDQVTDINDGHLHTMPHANQGAVYNSTGITATAQNLGEFGSLDHPIMYRHLHGAPQQCEMAIK
jgi:hypothetical protein